MKIKEQIIVNATFVNLQKYVNAPAKKFQKCL